MRKIDRAAAFVLCLALAGWGGNGFAQTSGGTTAAQGTHFITLGTTAGPLPRKDRTQASNLLIVNGTPYLIDAGDNVTRRIVQSGNDFRRVGKVFITHPHSDHTMGLATLMVSEWEYQRREPLDIYGPPGTAAIVAGAIAYLKVNAEIRWEEGKRVPMESIFKPHEILPGEVYKDANVTVTAVENSHFHFSPGSPPFGKYRSYSYRFAAADRSIVFTGDTGPSDAVTELAKGADVLVSEASLTDDVVAAFKRNGAWQAKTPDEQKGFIRHMEEEHLLPAEVGRMAAKAGVKLLVMTHLPPTATPDDDYQRYADEAAKYFSGKIVVAKDLMKF